MAEQDDVLHLIDDTGTVPEDTPARKWKIAVIDDDQAVHEGTRFALSDYYLNGQGLEILSAYSAAEGRALMRAHPDIAAVLLDVIMETDIAGLELVEFIRNEIRNETVRIILRTGQPGQAPERRVIVQYDINDYKAKTELTADKLFTSLTAALRSYQQLERMVQTRRGLEIIIDAASTLYDFKSMQRLAEGVLTQLASLLNVDCAGILVLRDGGDISGDFSVLAGSGCYSRFIGASGAKALDADLRSMVEAAFKGRKHEFVDQRTVLYVRTGSGREVVVLLQAERQLSETDRALVEIFGSRLSIAFDNVILYQQLQAANAQLEDRVAQQYPGGLRVGDALGSGCGHRPENIVSRLHALDHGLATSIISKSDLAAPQSGQLQSSGMSSHRVPGAMPSSGHPLASSYSKPHSTQTNSL